MDIIAIKFCLLCISYYVVFTSYPRGCVTIRHIILNLLIQGNYNKLRIHNLIQIVHRFRDGFFPEKYSIEMFYGNFTEISGKIGWKN